jgi:hypothetical protein
MPEMCRSPSPVEITAEGPLVSESNTDNLHRQHTTLDIVVESEEGQIVLKESYHILRYPLSFPASGVSHPPPTNVIQPANEAVDRVRFSRSHDKGSPKVVNPAVSTTPPTPTISFADTVGEDVLARSQLAPDVLSVTPETHQSNSATHEQPPSTRECSPNGTGGSDFHQDYDGDCPIGPDVHWFRMGARLHIPDRAAADDEYHRIKRQRFEQLRNTPNRHRDPAYAQFKAEYRQRKQEERNEERRIRSLAKQNADSAMFFQELETERDLKRRRTSPGSRHRSANNRCSRN